MKAAEYTISKILTEQIRYEIPAYQRPYSWEKGNVEQFLDDISEAYEASDEEYFIGSLITIEQEKDRRYDVVDGQQRLTTLNLIFSRLRDAVDEPAKSALGQRVLPRNPLTGEAESPRLTLRQRDQTFFRRHVLAGEPIPDAVRKEIVKEQDAPKQRLVEASGGTMTGTTGKERMARQATKKDKPNGGNGKGQLGFEGQLWAAADKLRGNMEPSDYKHVVLGLIFLKYISDAFEAKRAALAADELADPEDPEEYLAENVFWVPKEARWSHLQANARQPSIGKTIDEAMGAIESSNESLKGVLPKDYSRPALNKTMLGELIDLVSGIGMAEEADRSRDILGRVYEYFLAGFAGAEGKRGGEFYTPRSVVRLLVEMLEPYKGRVYDPCCGSGGMFVQSERFVEEHGGRIGDIAIYGQESNYTTWRLAKMNLAVRGIDADIRWNNEGSFHKDELKDLRADFILANPPFNVSDWGGQHLREDARWTYGAPPVGNANYAWLQHIVHHLAPNGTAGVVLANGSMSSQQSGEGEIRRAMVEADIVDCMIALPAQLFYSTQIPACLWFLARNKNPGASSGSAAVGHKRAWRDRRGEVLFIDARKLGHLVDRTRRELADEEIDLIAETYHAWRGEPDADGEYEDVPGFCKAARLEEIREHGHVLTPGRYVGAAAADDEDEPFEVRFAALKEQLTEQFAEAEELSVHITNKLREVGING